MKISIQFFILLSFGTFVTAQDAIIPSWMKLETSVIGVAEGWGITTDDQGNVYWTVSTDELNQGLDVKAYKFNAQGIELWNQPFLYGGPGTQHAYVNNFHDNHLYIGGRFCTGLINTCNMMLLKVNTSDQTLVWDRTFNFQSDGYDELDGLVLRPDAIYCGGWGQELQAGAFQSDIGLWKLNYEGETIFTNHFGKPETAEHQDGHMVVDEDNIFLGGLWNGGGIANLYNGQSIIGKFSKEDGSMIDTTLFGFQSDDFLDIENALGMTSEGDFLYLTGYSTPVSVNDWQIFVAKFDKDLNQIWYTDWGGTGTETARGISVVDGVIYIAGQTESPELLIGNQSDGLLLKMDTDGNPLSYYIWGDENKNAFQDIRIDEDQIYLTGTSQVTTTNTESAFLLAADGLTTSTTDFYAKENKSFKVFPNPSNGLITINLNHVPEYNTHLRIIDLQGNLHVSKSMKSAELKVSLLNPGFYLINLTFDNYSISRKVFVE